MPLLTPLVAGDVDPEDISEESELEGSGFSLSSMTVRPNWSCLIFAVCDTGIEGSSDIEAPKSVDTTNGMQSCSHTIYVYSEKHCHAIYDFNANMYVTSISGKDFLGGRTIIFLRGGGVRQFFWARISYQGRAIIFNFRILRSCKIFFLRFAPYKSVFCVERFFLSLYVVQNYFGNCTTTSSKI